MNHRQSMSKQDVMAELMAAFTPDQVERELTADRNKFVAPRLRCNRGHRVTYSHAVGAYRCKCGAIVRSNGEIVKPC